MKDDRQWLRRLLKGCHSALERMRGQGADADRELVADLKRYCAKLERQLRDAERFNAKPS